MPYVNVRITKDGVTAEQKAAIVREITDTLVRILGKRPDHTHIVIDEVETGKLGLRRQAHLRTPQTPQMNPHQLLPKTTAKKICENLCISGQ